MLAQCAAEAERLWARRQFALQIRCRRLRHDAVPPCTHESIVVWKALVEAREMQKSLGLGLPPTAIA